MNRRGFLQALFAVPVLAVPLLVPEAVASPVGSGTGMRALRDLQHERLLVTHVERDSGTVTFQALGPDDQWHDVDPPVMHVLDLARREDVQQFTLGQTWSFDTFEDMLRATS